VLYAFFAAKCTAEFGMNAAGRDTDGALGSPRTAGDPASSRLESQQWRQLILITLGALAIFFGLRLIPTGTNLSHMDFRVDPKAGSVIEFCDPLNPQFIPVVAARSPVTMSIATREPATIGREISAVITLKTGSGKPVTPEDLVVTHTRPLHLLVIDPSLADYQHVHPSPSARGEWAFSFVPRATGAYRIFADFTPAATARGLYASVDLNVSGAATAPTLDQVRDLRPSIAEIDRTAAKGKDLTHGSVQRDGIVFALSTAQPPRTGQPIDLRFAMRRLDGGNIPLEPVMGAFAHLVAFDQARSGFAHLHPAETDISKRPDAKAPTLNFKLTIPRAGRYVVWAQVNLGGTETFVPFDLSVTD
jgi:hypothetical protein